VPNIDSTQDAMEELMLKVEEAGFTFDRNSVSHRDPEKEGGFHKLVLTVEISVNYRPTICDR